MDDLDGRLVFRQGIRCGLCACWRQDRLFRDDIGFCYLLGFFFCLFCFLLCFRVLLFLLEALVLVIALIGVWSLTPDGFWGGRPGMRHRANPDGIFGYFARVLPPIGVIVGIYIFWTGADHPGGKFQGATILATMWMLVLMAGLADAPPIGRRWLRIGLVVGPLVFIAIGLAGVLVPGAFLAYPAGFAKPLIIAIEVALMPTLVLILGLLLAGAPERGARP